MAEAGVGSLLPSDEAPSEESLLLEHVRRVESAPKDHFAVHLHLSELRSQYRQPHFIRIAGRTFDALTAAHEVTLYVLGNADMVLICHNVPVEAIDPSLIKLRTLFSEDPLTYGTEGSLDDRFTTWYDLSQAGDFASFVSVVEAMVAAAAEHAQRRQMRGAGTDSAMLGEPLVPTRIATINGRLQAVRIADLVQRQSVVEVFAGAKGTVLFREHYVSMIDLQRRIAPDVNLFSDPWLFQYLTETVDRRLLSVMAQHDFAASTEGVSLNLNISTVQSPGFQTFHERARGATEKVIVEIQTIDIFADLVSYAQARDWLQGRGYRVLVDGLNPMALQFFDPSPLKADFVKVFWNNEFLGGIADDRLAEMKDVIDNVGRDRVILARADSEDAIKWALGLGIHRFQGHFIDKVVEAMIAKGII